MVINLINLPNVIKCIKAMNNSTKEEHSWKIAAPERMFNEWTRTCCELVAHFIIHQINLTPILVNLHFSKFFFLMLSSFEYTIRIICNTFNKHSRYTMQTDLVCGLLWKAKNLSYLLLHNIWRMSCHFSCVHNLQNRSLYHCCHSPQRIKYTHKNKSELVLHSLVTSIGVTYMEEWFGLKFSVGG